MLNNLNDSFESSLSVYTNVSSRLSDLSLEEYFASSQPDQPQSATSNYNTSNNNQEPICPFSINSSTPRNLETPTTPNLQLCDLIPLRDLHHSLQLLHTLSNPNADDNNMDITINVDNNILSVND